MLNFKNEREYLGALKADPTLAIMGLAMASRMLGIKRASVEQRIARSSLKGVKIGKQLHVMSGSLIEVMDQEDSMKAAVVRVLRSLIAKKQTQTYGVLMQAVGLDHVLSAHRKKIGAVLGEISEGTWERDKVLVSVLIVDKGTGMPSDSFWGLYRDLTGREVKDRAKVFANHVTKAFKIEL